MKAKIINKRTSSSLFFRINRQGLQALTLVGVFLVTGLNTCTEFLPVASAFLPRAKTTTKRASIPQCRELSLPTTSLLFAGFGSPSQTGGKKKKKAKNKKKSGGGGGETAAQVQQRWANKLKRVYGGISAEEIAAGTEKRIGAMVQTSLDANLRRALELREIVQMFERKISGMEADEISRRFSPPELEEAIANRRAYDDHMESNSLVPEDLQVAMQKVTWDASADAKACKSVTGRMPITTKNRVTRASEMAHEAILSDTNDGDDGLVLDVGCGYGVLVPFLKRAGFKAHQIHGVDLSSEMIGHARTFHPDVATKGDFRALDFLGEDQDFKYRAVVFCSSLHDMPDLRAALLKTKNELLDAKTPGSRLIIVHAQGASHVMNQHKQNPLLVPRGLPTGTELEEWLCKDGIENEENGEPVMKIVHKPAEPKSQGEIKEGYLAVLETV